MGPEEGPSLFDAPFSELFSWGRGGGEGEEGEWRIGRVGEYFFFGDDVFL